MRLFHASEEASIARFAPRPPPSPQGGVDGEVVWAVDEPHLPNYLLPRDCPRVTFADRGWRVVAVESAWLPRIQATTLYVYEFPTAGFALADAAAGYHVARRAVEPLGCTRVDDLVAELLRRDVELRLVPDLWPLRDEIAASTREFSIIRFRNARPRR